MGFWISVGSFGFAAVVGNEQPATLHRSHCWVLRERKHFLLFFLFSFYDWIWILAYQAITTNLLNRKKHFNYTIYESCFTFHIFNACYDLRPIDMECRTAECVKSIPITLHNEIILDVCIRILHYCIWWLALVFGHIKFFSIVWENFSWNGSRMKREKKIPTMKS